MSNQFLSVEEVAARMSVKRDTVRDWLKAGKLRGVKLGRVWRVPESALEELASGATGAADGRATEAARVAA